MNPATASPPASTRPRAGGAGALWLTALAGALSVGGCSFSQNGVVPPADTFFYPSSGIMNPADTTGQWLFVANGNADLRFNDGTLVMVNVGSRTDVGTMSGAALDRAQTWDQCPQADYVNPLPRSNAPICCRDLLDANIINCDERRYVASDATVAIGSFAAGMAWQSGCDDPTSCQPQCTAGASTGARILLGVRGDTSLTYIDVMPAATYGNAAPHPGFHCTSGLTPTSSLGECDQKVTDATATLVLEQNDPNAPDVTLPDEPYALAADPGRGFLYVGHLVGNTSTQNSGGISLFDISWPGPLPPGTFPPAPQFIAPFGGPFPPNSSGFFGITNLHLHAPLGSSQNGGQVVYASSRYVPLVSSMLPLSPMPACSNDDKDDVVIPGGNTLNANLVGSEMRGVEFMDPSDGSPAQRVYALERVPPDLVGFEIAQNYAGTTIATPTDVLETCSSPTFLYQHDFGDGVRLYVNCFDTGEVYIFDPAGPTLMTTFMVGRGPGGLVFDDAHQVAYVLDFSQNDVAVIDLAPGSPTQYHLVQRLGFPTVTPR